jgi:hypothetical protein
MSVARIRCDDDADGAATRAVARARRDDGPGPHRRVQRERSTALLLVRSADEVEMVLRDVNGLLGARRAAGVFDVVVGAFVGPRHGLRSLAPWGIDDVIGAGHLVRSSCTFSDRWTLTWFDDAIVGAGDTRSRRRQLLAALGWDRCFAGLSTDTTFLPVLAPDERWSDGGDEVVAELMARHPDLRLGHGVLVDDGRAGIVRPV